METRRRCKRGHSGFDLLLPELCGVPDPLLLVQPACSDPDRYPTVSDLPCWTCSISQVPQIESKSGTKRRSEEVISFSAAPNCEIRPPMRWSYFYSLSLAIERRERKDSKY